MSTFVPLAHGVFGIWDELIPLFILIGFGAVFVLSAVIGQRRQKDLAKKQDTAAQGDSTVQPDHFRLD